ncbi:hypothetical protein [Enterobacter hormaechei]|uniref:hypothetical protein n=2 Tax=Enterobacteriaceae TaxID=543 RepID=UPI0005ECA58B|nr:hypothetical protein [Enterobacter hormaechei]KJM79835.1 hypothetical protein SS12_14505 [Enterobacter hormaechei subsp. hoffmannii]
MDLQAWDNVISIASNAVTTVSVVGGVLFGRRKVNEWLSQKIGTEHMMQQCNILMLLIVSYHQ